MDRQKISENLKLFRKKLGLNQRQFAESLGITGGYISAIEKGKGNLSESVLCLIEINYRLNRNWLLNGEGEPFVEEWLEDKTFLFADKGGPIKEHSQGMRMHLEAISGAQAEENKRKEAEKRTRSKAKQVSIDESIESIKNLNESFPVLNELIKVLPLENISAKQVLSEILKIISISLNNTSELEKEIQQLKAENNQLKTMLREAGQDFKDLIGSIKKIIEQNSPPDSLNERRKGIADIYRLLVEKQKQFNNSDSVY